MCAVADVAGCPWHWPELRRSSELKELSRHFDNRPTGRRLCRPCPDTLAKRVGQSRAVYSQSGNSRLRTTIIQLAWLWLRHQPRSALTLWFQDRMERNGGRRRKTTIVALARKLLVALWK